MFLFIPITGMVKIICERVDGLQPWAILIGTEDHKKLKPKKKLPTTATENKGV
jgi:AI-2 transport protein TqsA